VLSHASWHEERARSNERLEFLGDAVLGLVAADELYRRFPDVAEGVLSQRKHVVVSRESCAVVGRALGLDALLRERGASLGHAGAGSLAATPSVVAALTEAAIGAVFAEHGFEVASAAVAAAFADRFDLAVADHVDAKTALQEHLQRGGRSVEYRVVRDTGPPHDRRFVSTAESGGVELGRGEGRSKQASEQAAASAALAAIGSRPCT
jgi:ribonuclease-3